jgi:drug/metabolite transporter (DMT)-like permease
MKKGMEHLTAYQVASFRIVASALVLMPLLPKAVKIVPFRIWPLVFLSGALGSLFPAYLFCLAETKIESSLAGALNALTPIFVILCGGVFFGLKTTTQKIIGVLVAFAGCVGLFFSRADLSFGENQIYLLFVLIATCMYGINVNLVQRYLKEIPSLQLVSLAMLLIGIPALGVLIFTGYFALDFSDEGVLLSSGYTLFLGIGSTALANILFYVLIKKAGAVFSSMVTYGIPFVAIAWGLMFGEKVGWAQIMSLAVILGGVYVANAGRVKE